MLEIITSWPVTYQIIIINTSFVFVIVFLFLAAKFGLNFTGKNFSLSFGLRKKKTGSAHSNCSNRSDALESLKNIREIERKIIELKYMDVIKDQMTLAEGSVKLATNKLLRIYTSLLKEKGAVDPIKTDSCQSYMLILRIIENRLIDRMRIFIRENHFADKTEAEFDTYIESKITDLIYLVSDTLNDLYYYDKDINRAQLYDANENKIRDFEHIIRECFQHCRIYAVETKEKIELLEKESSSIYEKFISN